MADKLKIGVIGVGKMGTLHLGKLLDFSAVQVLGIYDIDVKRAQLVSSQFGVQSLELAELLSVADAAIIASPTVTHYPIGRQALEMGVSVLIEKPMAESIEEATELAQFSEREGLCLQVGLIERFRYLSLAEGLALSPVRFVESHRLAHSPGRESSVDVVTDLMIHDLDLVLSLIREELLSISAVGLNVLSSSCDLANVHLEFSGGAVVNLTASRVSPKRMRKFRVFSDNVHASMDFVSNSVDVYQRNVEGGLDHRLILKPHIDALREQDLRFVDSVQCGKPAEVTGRDGIRALQCASIIRSKIAERTTCFSPKVLRSHATPQTEFNGWFPP